MTERLTRTPRFWFPVAVGGLLCGWSIALLTRSGPNRAIDWTIALFVVGSLTLLLLLIVVARLEKVPLGWLDGWVLALVAILLALVVLVFKATSCAISGSALKWPPFWTCVPGLNGTLPYVVLGEVAAGAVIFVLLLSSTRRWVGWYRFRAAETAVLMAVIAVGVAGLLSLGRRLLERLQPEPVEWALFGIGLSLLARQLALFVRRKQPGPVEVSLLTNATEDTSIKPEALTAQFREGLAQIGLRQPPSVPAASLPQTVIDVTSEALPDKAAALAKAMSKLWQFVVPANGHKVTGVIRKREEDPPLGVTIELSDLASGAVERVSTTWAPTADGAISDTAYVVYQDILQHPDLEPSSPWQRWTDREGRGLRAYVEALALERTDSTAAIEKYEEAAGYEPLNAILRLRLGATFEKEKMPAKGLTRYLESLNHWHRLARVEYRVAVSCSFAKEVTADYRSLSTQDQERFAAAFKQVGSSLFGEPSFPSDGDDLQILKALLDRAQNHWDRLRTHLPDRGEDLDPFAFHNAVIVATKVLALRRAIELDGQSPPPLIGDRKVRWASRHERWHAHYNAACYFAVAMEGTAGAEMESRASLAVEHLQDAFAPSTSRIPNDWVCQDPDLRLLRDTTVFRTAFPDWCGEEAEMGAEEDALGGLCKAWDVLASRAEKASKKWEEHLENTRDWAATENEAKKWAETEQEVWSALASWADRPLNEALRKGLWARLREHGDLPDKEPDPAALRKCTEPDAWQRAVDITDHVERWRTLSDRAHNLAARWKTLVDSWNLSAGPYSLQGAKAWMRAAIACWSSLHAYALTPDSPVLEDDLMNAIADLEDKLS